MIFGHNAVQFFHVLILIIFLLADQLELDPFGIFPCALPGHVIDQKLNQKREGSDPVNDVTDGGIIVFQQGKGHYVQKRRCDHNDVIRKRIILLGIRPVMQEEQSQQKKQGSGSQRIG